MKYAPLYGMLLLLDCNKPRPASVDSNLPTENRKQVNNAEYSSITGATAIVNSPGINIRATPSTSGKILAVVQKGAKVELVGRSFRREALYKCEFYWFLVKHGPIEGWLYGQFLNEIDDAGKKHEKIKKGDLEIEFQVPRGWTDDGTWEDISGNKIAEGPHLEEFSGDFHNHVRDRNTPQGELIGQMTLNRIENFTGTPYEVDKVVTSVVFGGGCPTWAGEWYPITYYYKIDNKKLISFTFYLRDESDSKLAQNFDQIARSLLVH